MKNNISLFHIFIGTVVLMLGTVIVLILVIVGENSTDSPNPNPAPSTQQIQPTAKPTQPRAVAPTPESSLSAPESPTPSTPTITINDVVVSVEIANTPEKRTQGLSGRQSLPQNSGMLFIFDIPYIPSFWMYNMNFALDFVWIRDNTIVDITENVPPPIAGTPDSELLLYTPNAPVNMMLELNAGWVARNGGKDALLKQTVQLNI